MLDSFISAVSQLGNDRFRTLLSLSGVTIGVFSIVAVFTLVDSLDRAVKDGFETYGTDILFVEQTPLEPDLNENGTFRWWEYVGRPPVTFGEYRYLSSQLPETDMAFKCSSPEGVLGVCGKWDLVIQERLAQGRPFTSDEIKGSFAVMIGDKIREERFGRENPIGRKVMIYGYDFTVTGCFEAAGANLVSTVDTDNSYVIPFDAMKRVVDLGRCQNSIVIERGDEDEIRTIMRSIRRIPFGKKDDFAVNRLSYVLEEVSGLFTMINRIGWIVGIFSLLVGGFGIANIMYVSVQERKPEIGIQKALGAKRMTVVTQYLAEAVILSTIGGILGILLVFVGTILLPEGMISVSLNAENCIVGVSVSLILGLISGAAPAFRAASLDAVEAINSI